MMLTMTITSTRRLSVVLLTLGFVVLVVSALRSYTDEEYIALGRWSSENYASSVVKQADTVMSTDRRPHPRTNGSRDPVLNSHQGRVLQQQHSRRRRPFLSRLGGIVRSPLFWRNRRNHQEQHMASVEYSVDLLASTLPVVDTVITQARNSYLAREAKESSPLLARLRSTLRRNEDANQVQQQLDDEATDSSSISLDKERILNSLAEPLIEKGVWESLTGSEYQENPERLDALAAMGEQLARQDTSNDWINWNAYGTHKHSLEEGDIHVWVGKSKRDGEYLHSKAPFIKTRSIAPLAPEEMVDLLLDSERVHTYNQLSIGREDVWEAEDTLSSNKGAASAGRTKIVKNRTKIPMSSKTLVSVTLLHARPLETEPGAWLVVSRAVGGTAFQTELDRASTRSDILLGINLLQPVPGDDESCIVTAITHVYTSAVPSMLAEQLGVKGAVKFVKDIRKLKVPA